MTSDGTNGYVWDRANRLLSMGGISYAYNGDGNRIQQDALNYILDLQPGLAQVIGDSDGNRYVHSPRGIHAVSDGSAWTYPLTDALGSVRGYADASNNILSNVNYTPIGVPDMNIIGPAFTGEWRNESETQYHGARHLSPGLGVWLSLDPWEGLVDRPMSLNGYAWVEGQFPNATDASGFSPNCCHCDNMPAGRQDQCYIECLRSTPPGRECPRNPITGRVLPWEEDLLNIVSISEYRLAALSFSAIDTEKLAYVTSWIILNRITSPCWTSRNITTIAQSAFSGSAIRNSTVYPPALAAAFDETFRRQHGANYYIANYSGITQSMGQKYVNAVLELLQQAGYASEVGVIQRARPGVIRALNEWCQGIDGPGVAINAINYVTLASTHPSYRDEQSNIIDPNNEKYDQLGALQRLHSGNQGPCTNFGWIGTATEHWMLVDGTYTLGVPVRQGDRDRGRQLLARKRIRY
jgi:RHS repeat-associated protein